MRLKFLLFIVFPLFIVSCTNDPDCLKFYNETDQDLKVSAFHSGEVTEITIKHENSLTVHCSSYGILKEPLIQIADSIKVTDLQGDVVKFEDGISSDATDFTDPKNYERDGKFLVFRFKQLVVKDTVDKL